MVFNLHENVHVPNFKYSLQSTGTNLIIMVLGQFKKCHDRDIRLTQAVATCERVYFWALSKFLYSYLGSEAYLKFCGVNFPHLGLLLPYQRRHK